MNEEQKRNLAREITTLMLRRDLIQRGPCEVCGVEPAEGHHDDYDRPFELRWLCRSHHASAHQGGFRGFGESPTKDYKPWHKKPGRPRKHESNAARQKAYRERVEKRKAEDPKREAREALKQLACAVFAPKGTKCKFCGKHH